MFGSLCVACFGLAEEVISKIYDIILARRLASLQDCIRD